MNDLCWSSSWSLTTTKLYSDIKFGLWECDAGLFDYILNENTHNCGLNTYKFKNNLFHLSYDEFNREGEIFPESCWSTEEEAHEEEGEETDHEGTTDTEVEETETTALSSDLWF